MSTSESTASDWHRENGALHVALAGMGDAVITTDAEGRVRFLNSAAQSLTGWTLPDAAGQPIARVFHIIDQESRQPVTSFADGASGDAALAHHCLLIAKDGTERLIDECAVPTPNGNGGAAGAVLVFRDITERTRAEVAVRASEVRYRRLFETAQDAILILDGGTGKIIDSNPFLSGLLGYSSDELLGKELWEIGLFQDIAANRAAFRQLQEKGYIRYEDLPLQTKDGRRAFVEFVSNVYPVEGRPIIQCNIRDISDRKQAEAGLREADRRKDEFLAMLAHELRNPLGPIRNAVEVIRLKGAQEPEVRWAQGVAERQVQQLSRLVDDLLDVSRFNRGKISVQMQPVDLAAVVARAVEISGPLIDAHRHSLSVSLPEPAVRVQGDMTRLAQVLSNLLNNAAKYTDDGGRIDVTVTASGAEAILSVRDTGVGIAADVLPQIFDMFTQVPASADRAAGGLGIGLTLVRSLVQIHGGTVAAFSEGPGHGCKFVVRLPLLHQAAPDAGTRVVDQQDRKFPARNVLIVDDNHDAADTLARLLHLHGQVVQTAYDGSTALDLARVRPPDIVFLDIGMPVMDGLEVARRLRRDAGLKQALLVALTGYGAVEDRRRSQAAGFNAHLVKPVDLVALESLLAWPAFSGQEPSE